MKKKILIILFSLITLSLIVSSKISNNQTNVTKEEIKKIKMDNIVEEIETEGLIFLAPNQQHLNYYFEDSSENKKKIVDTSIKEDEIKIEDNNYIGKDETKFEEIEELKKEEEIVEESDDKVEIKEEIVESKNEEIKSNSEEIKNPNFKEIDGKTYYYENGEIVKGLKLIDGIRHYFDFNTGELIKSNVKSIIDISYWQGDIDFEELKSSNLIDGVIVRVGYGTSISDECVLDLKFQRNIEELNRLNIPYGIYIYGYAQNENAAKKEAKFVYDSINKYNVKLSYPVFYDAEIDNYKGVKYTKSLYEKVISTFYNEMDNYKINSGVYGNLYMLTKGSLNSDLIKKNVWVAQYYNRCDYKEDYIGWQYTSSGYVSGINGRVDLNIFY